MPTRQAQAQAGVPETVATSGPVTHMNKLLHLMVLILVGAVVYLFVRVNALNDHQADEPVGGAGDHVEVADYMGRIHQYAIKLWAAGVAGNFELAAFYTHELEEVMEELEGHGVIDDGVDISAKLKVHGFPALEAMEAKLLSRDAEQFASGYSDLLANCNACHAASGYHQIRVVVPAQAPLGQDFSPLPGQ